MRDGESGLPRRAGKLWIRRRWREREEERSREILTDGTAIQDHTRRRFKTLVTLELNRIPIAVEHGVRLQYIIQLFSLDSVCALKFLSQCLRLGGM